MDQFKGENILDFGETFPNDDACKAYLADLKWNDGFTCKKCGGDTGCLKKDYNYHCYTCNHVESSTAGTLFHRNRFGLRKAFFIVFEMVNSTKGLSSVQVAKRYGIRQPTAWTFMHKVREAMKSSQKYPMQGTVQVDEFVVGGIEENRQGRSYKTNKSKAVIAVELTDNHRVKRVYIKAIDDYSAKSLTPIFEQHIDTDAKVITDKWRGYSPLKNKFNIEQIPSNKGKNFFKLHIMIYKLKSWLRTVPVHVSKKHIEAYFNEFAFRINRSQHKETIFDNIIRKMVNSNPISYLQIIQKSNR